VIPKEAAPKSHTSDSISTFQNIYANIQNSGRPCYMSFDLNDKSCWKPFYTRRFPRPNVTKTSFQDSELVYREPDANSSYELQMRLKDFLKESFRQWRRMSTCFNGDIGNRLDAILEHLEYDKLHAISSFPQKYKMILESATKGRRIFGLDFHFPFTSLNDVITSVEAAGIHMCRHPDVEFAVGARVFPYCNDLYSIRVFIISIFP
jgi:coiled-coil and C2 domain-containing protein 2A